MPNLDLLPFPGNDQPTPDYKCPWEHAYKTLLAVNEAHVAELETANTLISALSDKVDSLKRVIKRAQVPVFSSIDLDDDSLWDVED